MKQLYYHLRWMVLFLPVFAIPDQLQAQQKTTITGMLADSSNNKPVPWATVGLYKISNTQKPLQNIFSNGKGKFEFNDVDTGDYTVIVTYTGYIEKERTVRVDPGKTTIDVTPIILSPEPRQLAGVTVKASIRRPLLEQEDEKIIYNAETDPSLEGLTAVDVLRKTPFVSVDGEGNVQLNGQSSFKILLNGKETAMFAKNIKEALRSFSASLIRKVEVSTNPSSKYDGEGVGGIINIITHKKVIGYNGSAGITYNTNNSYNFNTSLNIKYGKMGVSGYYGMGGGRLPQDISQSEVESLHPIAFYKRTADSRSRSNYFWNFGNIEFAWDLDSMNTLSIYGGVNGGNGKGGNSTTYNTILPGNAGSQVSFLNGSNEYKYPSYDLGVDYVRKLRGLAGKEISMKVNYNDAKDDTYNYSEQLSSTSNRYVINDNSAPNKQATLQFDLALPFKNGNKLETGIKSIIRKANADYASSAKYDEAHDYEQDPANSNYFNYRQDVYSAFATYSFKWQTISFKIGGRFEQTHVNGDFTTTSTQVRQDYGTLMPAIYLSRKFNKIHNVSLSYSKRLRRPYIWDLNPFVSNTDSFNISYGNPQLGPDIIHSIESGYTVFKGNTNINIRFSQSFSNREIIRYTNFDAVKGVSATVTDNAGVSRVTGLNINISTKFSKKWTFSTGAGMRYVFIKNRFRPEQRNDGFGGYGNINTNYTITKKWTVYLSGSCYRSIPQLQGQWGWNYSYSSGMNYKLFKEKVTAGISASNFLRKYQVVNSYFQDENFIRSNINRNYLRNISFSLRWNFGKLTENVSRKKGVSNDDIRK